MKEIGKRLRGLRDGIGISQAKMGEVFGITQATVNRYETGYATVPVKILLQYADYFDVSMDYLCCRTDKPQGKLYDFNTKYVAENKELARFVDMCFDPDSPINERLRKTITAMLTETEEGKK